MTLEQDVNNSIFVRAGYGGDQSFILATWLRGSYYGNSLFKEIDKDVFMKNYYKVIENILSRATTKVLVAALKEDKDIVLGYSVLDENTLHWVYVKEAWRKLGIAKKLVPQTISVTTHLTSLGKIIKPKTMAFNPFII